MNRKKIVFYWRGLATACLLAFGATVFGIGTVSLTAQSPSPLDSCGSDGTSVCLEGEFCFWFFCWSFEKYWPEAQPEPGPILS